MCTVYHGSRTLQMLFIYSPHDNFVGYPCFIDDETEALRG